MSQGSIGHVDSTQAAGLTKFGPISLRVYHEAEKPRNGRMVSVAEGGLYPSPGGDGESSVGVTGVQIFQNLAECYDLEKYSPHVYCSSTDCFVAVHGAAGHFYSAQVLCPDNKVPPRLDVRMLSRGISSVPAKVNADSLLCDSSATDMTSSWFGIGITRGKVCEIATCN